MSHNHNHAETFGRHLLLSMLINLLIPAAQMVGGLLAGSVALISDAVHNLGDFTALLVAFVANKVGRTGPSVRHTFGLRRMEIFAAVINAALLGGAAAYIAVEAMGRLSRPAPVAVDLVAYLALAGIVGNGLSAWLLHKDSEKNLNARGAFLHMVGDLLTSVAVLVGALAMQFMNIPWLDPVLSLAIVAYIILNCFWLLKDAVHVLMNGTPRGLDLEAVKTELETLSQVEGIHYLHAWSMGNQSVAMTCHVVVPDQLISATETLSKAICEKLLERFGIDHPVLQFETRPCGKGALLCQMACGANSDCGHIC
ncbi:MAG: cation diffusion facilitator family transporter [Desulfosarcinaceae bacterium]